MCRSSRFSSSSLRLRAGVASIAGVVFAVFAVSTGRVHAAERGDSNSDGKVDIADATFVLGHLFLTGPAPECPSAADANSDAAIDLSDSVFLLVHLFGGGPAPAPLSDTERAACGDDIGGGTLDPNVRGLFLSTADFERIQDEADAGREPFRSNLQTALNRAEGALGGTPRPFHMENIFEIRFGECEDFDPNARTLKTLSRTLQRDSSTMRDLALGFALSGERRYGDRALEYLLAWSRESTLVNLYDFDIDFAASKFRGKTDDGYCGVRSWHFALDAMWVTYGLINVSDTYLLLVKNGYPFSPSDEAEVRGWILDLVESVNASFHAWTRWADAHPSSESFERYRSDNHLSWCLAGLLAGGIALEDEELIDYCLHGGTWVDRHAGPYKNPSPITDVIDRAIESGTGAANEGRLYEEKIRRDPPIGYALFHMWPMALVALQAEIHRGEDIWSYRGRDGAGLENAYDRYAAYPLHERSAPEGDLRNQRWQWEFAYRRWPKDRYRRVIGTGPRNVYLIQSIGPVILIADE